MHEKTEVMQEKSFTGSIYGMFDSTLINNVIYQYPKIKTNEHSVTHETVEDLEKSNIKECLPQHKAPYVTSEQFHGLNKKLSLCRSIIRSTSTIFYDLDEIAKRHSFHCLPEPCTSNANILDVMKLKRHSGFKGKSDVIVQECSTQIKPKFFAKDSMEINSKKTKKTFPHNDVLSSEIFLRDNNFGKHCRKNQYYNIDVMNHQKFWSYAKYRTEYTKPIPEEKKAKKKDKGKRTEDPCPCQLFSYTCPCSDEKSLTELAKNNKVLPVLDQVTSTTLMTENAKKNKLKRETPREDKITNTITKTETKIEAETQDTQKQNIPLLSDVIGADKNKSHPRKKSHKIICPKCQEKVEVLSITDDNDSLKCNSRCGSKEISCTEAYNCSTSFRNKNKSNNGDSCSHDPRCELIPICQILPTEDMCSNQKYVKKRLSPKVIRITKACRHHPPCTVVPSCQRANVLRNNCEFIPPCLHRPRCVNLPLCVPLAKSINYDEFVGKHEDDDENTECRHVPRCKLIPLCQHDSTTNNTEHHFNLSTRGPNGCDYINDYNTATYIISPKATFMGRSPSPGKLSTPNSPCCSCRSNKSCQYNCFQFKTNSLDVRESTNTEGIIYIRDVGCQFQNKSYLPKDSLLNTKYSSASFEYTDLKSEKHCSNFRTLRYEDKFTNPILRGSPLSTDSVMSGEIDSNCPSHGRGRCMKNQYSSGFRPKSAFVTAYAKNMSSISQMTQMSKDGNKSKNDVPRLRDTFPVKSRRSFLKGKYQKMFAAKRRSGFKTSNHFMSYISRKVAA